MQHKQQQQHPFNGPLSGTIWMSWNQKSKTNLEFTEARDSEWQWHQLDHYASLQLVPEITMPAPHHSVILQVGFPSSFPTNSNKARKVF